MAELDTVSDDPKTNTATDNNNNKNKRWEWNLIPTTADNFILDFPLDLTTPKFWLQSKQQLLRFRLSLSLFFFTVILLLSLFSRYFGIKRGGRDPSTSGLCEERAPLSAWFFYLTHLSFLVSFGYLWIMSWETWKQTLLTLELPTASGGGSSGLGDGSKRNKWYWMFISALYTIGLVIHPLVVMVYWTLVFKSMTLEYSYFVEHTRLTMQGNPSSSHIYMVPNQSAGLDHLSLILDVSMHGIQLLVIGLDAWIAGARALKRSLVVWPLAYGILYVGWMFIGSVLVPYPRTELEQQGSGGGNVFLHYLESPRGIEEHFENRVLNRRSAYEQGAKRWFPYPYLNPFERGVHVIPAYLIITISVPLTFSILLWIHYRRSQKISYQNSAEL